jgi:hypothetical protein
MVGKRKRVEAVGYMRTSSAANVGKDKDSERRQRTAIEGYALCRRRWPRKAYPARRIARTFGQGSGSFA